MTPDLLDLKAFRIDDRALAWLSSDGTAALLFAPFPVYWNVVSVVTLPWRQVRPDEGRNIHGHPVSVITIFFFFEMTLAKLEICCLRK